MTREKAGPPRGPYQEDRKVIRLAVLPDEHAAIRVAAARAGLPMSEFCRRAAVQAAGYQGDNHAAPPKKARGRRKGS
jgi:hypothetical protein